MCDCIFPEHRQSSNKQQWDRPYCGALKNLAPEHGALRGRLKRQRETMTADVLRKGASLEAKLRELLKRS